LANHGDLQHLGPRRQHWSSERDNGEGTADKACRRSESAKAGLLRHSGPKDKKIYKIEMSDRDVGKAVRKIGYID